MSRLDLAPPTGRLDRLRVRGKRLGVDLEALVADAEVTLAVDGVTTVEVSMHDPYLSVLDSRLIDVGGAVDYQRLKLAWTVCSTEPGDDGVPMLVATARALVVRRMRRDRGEQVWRAVSPTQVAERLAKASKARFVGQPSAQRRQIKRAKKESSWGLLQRLATELGYVCFEAAGTVYFGKPTWLLARKGVKERHVSWERRQIEGDPGLAEFPECRRSEDAKRNHAEIVVRLWTEDADTWLPGEVLVLHGVPTFSGRYLINSVTVPLVADEPVEVAAATPVNPKPQPPPKKSRDGSSDSGGSASGQVERFVAAALRQTGDRYDYAAEVSLSDPDPDVFDCSELVQWAAAQAGLGSFPDGSSNQLAHCQASGTMLSVEAGIATRGALLFHPGHVAISLGNGRTIEAANRTYGVVQLGAAGRFTSAARVPGLAYGR